MYTILMLEGHQSNLMIMMHTWKKFKVACSPKKGIIYDHYGCSVAMMVFCCVSWAVCTITLCTEPQLQTTEKQVRLQIWPDVGGLLGELRGHEGEVFSHLYPEVRFWDAAVVCMDSMDTSHLPGYQSERRHTNIRVIWLSSSWLDFQHEIIT